MPPRLSAIFEIGLDLRQRCWVADFRRRAEPSKHQVKPFGMAQRGRGASVGVGAELLGSELPNQRVQRTAASCRHLQQRLVGQRGQQRQRGLCDVLRRTPCQAADEHRQGRQRTLLACRQQLPGAFERGAHAAVVGALLAFVGAAVEHVERGFELLHDLGHRQQANPIGGQKNRERQTVCGSNQRADRFGLCVRIELGARGERRSDEHPHRVAGEQFLCARLRTRHVQAGQRQQPFAWGTKAYPRRDADLQPGCTVPQPLCQVGKALQVLAVVENQQHLARGEMGADQRQRLLLRARCELHFRGDSRQHLARVLQIVERDPERAVDEPPLEAAQGVLHQCALAGATGPGHGEQPARVTREQRGQFREFLGATEEAIAGGAAGGCRRRRRHLHRVSKLLAHPLRRRDAQFLLEAKLVASVRLALRLPLPEFGVPGEQGDDGVFIERVGVEQSACEGDAGFGSAFELREPGARQLMHPARVQGALRVQPVAPDLARAIVHAVEQLAAAVLQRIGDAALAYGAVQAEHVGVNGQAHRAALHFERRGPRQGARVVQGLAQVRRGEFTPVARPEQLGELGARYPAAPQCQQHQQLAAAFGVQGRGDTIVLYLRPAEEREDGCHGILTKAAVCLQRGVR